MKKVMTIATALALITGTYGMLEWADYRYVQQKEHEELVARVSLAELELLYRRALNELYFWRDQARRYPNDPEVQQRLREAQAEVDRIKDLMAKFN